MKGSRAGGRGNEPTCVVLMLTVAVGSGGAGTAASTGMAGGTEAAGARVAWVGCYET